MSTAAVFDSRSPGRIFFDAVLLPHRSLSPRGFRVLLGVTASMMLGVGMIFMLLGAWPVIGFCGVEFLILYVMFRLNYRSGRAREAVRLSGERGLEVRRISPGGRTDDWRLEPTWLRVEMDNPPKPESRLTLTTHGRSLAIGRFLTPEERLEVATELKSALHAWRTSPPVPR